MLSEGDVFSSVFGTNAALHTTPTPLATPLLGDTGFGQSFGGPATPAKQLQNNSAAQSQVKRNLAWSTATRHLTLEGLKFETIIQGPKHSLRPKRHSRDVEEALDFLLNGDHGDDARDEQWDLIEWYTAEVRSHFLESVEPQLAQAWSRPIPLADDSVPKALHETVNVLANVQEQYVSRLDNDILSKLSPGTAYPGTQGLEPEQLRSRKRVVFLKKLHALFLHAFPTQRLSNALSWVLFRFVSDLLAVDGERKASSNDLFTVLGKIQHVGLGDNFGQRAFATAMWRVLDDFITGQHMKIDWDKQRTKTKILSRFLSHGFMPLIAKCIPVLGGTADDACQYQKIAVARLGRHRIANLFDYIVRWDQSLGAIVDIKEYIATPDARFLLTASFSDQVLRRLLHAGATTTHILNIYINIIHAFNELDPKGVLLDKVARPIRHYLRGRDDTARVIVASLLAEVDEDGNPVAESTVTDVSVEIAKEMAKPIVGLDGDENQNMDFDDMQWTPDPVDAGPDFKRSKNQDVTSALLSLYNREDFINELKTILGEHLLRSYDMHEHFEKEERLLELFKNRLGEDKLQACEVMLRDVQSSNLMNKTIQRDPAYVGTYNKLGHLDMYTHILSSFFWPSLRDDDFKVPEPVQALRLDYERAFEAVKDTRKLRWMTALGRATVELEFEDRKVEEEVPTWTASVIYAFESETGEAPNKSVTQLEEELEMDETLVRNALAFWRSKQVLRETEQDTYTVIENLSSLSKAEEAAVPIEEDAAVSAVRSQEELLNEHKELYQTFIINMLTNQGNLPLMRIFMMMKVAVPGGFPFDMAQVRSLLQDLVTEGQVVGQGDVYGIRR